MVNLRFKLKNFEYDKSGQMQQEIICYAFHSDLLKAKESELCKFLNTLSEAFPITVNDDGTTKIIENQKLLDAWNNAYSNVSRLLEVERQRNRHRSIVSVSIGTFVVLSVTLLWHVYFTK